MSTQIRSDFFLRRCGIIGTVLLCFSVVLLAGCDSASTNEPARTVARPVAYMTLSESDPSRHALVAGSVESWKKELVGFQVDGRVNFVRDPGVGVQGRVIDDDAKVTNGGTLVASLDNERYRLRVEEAKARVDSARAEAQAVMTDIEKTIPNELREVQAEHERARKELRRQQRLLRQGAGTQARVDNVRAEFKAASARLARTRSKQEERRAQYASAEAQIVQAREGLRQAQADLSDTELYSPFNGQVSRVHVIPGGYVEQGQPVVTVQMMDPMKVQVAVSPATDREVHFNDLMKVFVAGSDKPLNGWVWNKDTVADASTRTFMVTLLVRNRQVEVGLSEELRGKPFHRTDGLWNLESELDNAAAPYFTNVDTLRTDENGHFVWRVRGLSVSDLERDFEPGMPEENRLPAMCILY
ncbi:MAG: HlyD family efflux transporter periplasmic adaptor subunit [Pseudomonadota bacterium]